jgi:quinone-modifying oxidoreductase subunit QmoA
MKTDQKAILVIGGGIAGITAAVEAAEVGFPVVLVEKEAYLGGRVIRSHRYFPKMCPPACGFEINMRRIRRNPRITVHTLSTVEEISGTVGNFRARIVKNPRYVTDDPPLDEAVVDQITSERPDDFNLALGNTKAVYYPHDMAYPPLHMIDKDALSNEDKVRLLENSPSGSIDLQMPVEELEIDAGAIIVATGWRPYDATKIEDLGFGKHPNVITNVIMERLAAPGGPTGGEILRPSDGRKAQNVAFIQCAGSRDENHLPYCSSVCCMASLKQVRYLREGNEDSRATVFYIDIRTIGRLEKFYYNLLEDEKVSFFKGKVARIDEEDESQDLVLEVEDTLAHEKPELKYDLVVLATGIVPNTLEAKVPFELNRDGYGFVDDFSEAKGVFSAGCSRNPCDVARTTKESTAAALKAIQCLREGE